MPGNLTQVNITLPSNFTFTSFSNQSDNTVHVFSNTSTVLSWFNATSLVNGAARRFVTFNVTVTQPGFYNLSVRTLNISGGRFEFNLTVQVNDTAVASQVEYDSAGFTSNTNVSRTFIPINMSVADNGIYTVSVFLMNSTRDIINTSVQTFLPIYFVNFTGLSDGTYYVNASVNDSYSNANGTVSTLRIQLDTAAPTVSVTEDTTETTSFSADISASDATSGVFNTCTIPSEDGNNPQITGTGSSQTLTDSELGCGEQHTYTVRCVDAAGNAGSDEFTVTLDSCGSSSGSGSGGSGSSSSSTTWSKTVVADSVDVQTQPVTQSLGSKQRMRVKVAGVAHHVGVTAISGNSVTIEVSSTPQTATVEVGSSKNFDLDGDGYYDLKVTVTSVEDGKANVSAEYLHEEVPASEGSSGSGSGSEGSGATGSESSSGSSAFWIILVIVVIAVVIGVWYYMRRK